MYFTRVIFQGDNIRFVFGDMFVIFYQFLVVVIRL